VDRPYEQAESLLSPKLASFHGREEAKRRALEAEARRKAEEEAERKRQELLKKAEEERQAALAKAKAEQEARFLEEAAKRELEGDKGTAELILNAASELPPPEVAPVPIPVVPVEPVAVAPTVPKVEGLSFTTTWKWEVTHLAQVPRVST